MFFRRQKNPLRSFIFADAHIQRVARHGAELFLELVDYRDLNVRIVFQGVVNVEMAEGVLGLSVADAKFERLGDAWKLRLLDDDNENLLAVQYGDAQIEVLRDSDV